MEVSLADNEVQSEEKKSAAEGSPAPAEEIAENNDDEATSNAAENSAEEEGEKDETAFVPEDENKSAETTEQVASEDKAEVESDGHKEDAVDSEIEATSEESEEPSSPSAEEEEEEHKTLQTDEVPGSPSEEHGSPTMEEGAIKIFAEVDQEESALELSSASAAEKDMKESESGGGHPYEEEGSLEEPAKASVSDLATESASSISSTADRGVEKDDSHAEGSDDDSNHPKYNAARRTTQASSVSQILALIRKNILSKLRTPGATFFELFSPVLMMLVLSAAYTLTEIIDKNAETYASINLSFPGPWIDLAQRSTAVFGSAGSNADIAGAIGRRRKLKKRRYGEEDPNLLVQMTSAAYEPKTWNGIFEGLQQKLEQVILKHTHETVSHEMDQSHNRRLQMVRNRVDTSADAEAESYELLDDALDEVSAHKATTMFVL